MRINNADIKYLLMEKYHAKILPRESCLSEEAGVLTKKGLIDAIADYIPFK